ncbi:3',5'-cyclic-nucleotide phosphodiesterase, partial [Mortierella polycephala]
LTAASFESALTLLEHRPPSDLRPIMLLVDVDTDLELVPPHSPGSYPRHHRHQTGKNNNTHSGNLSDSVEKALGNGQRHLRATSENTSSKGIPQRNHRNQNRHPKTIYHGGASCGQDFLETVLQGIAKGNLHHVVPIAVSSMTTQDRIQELFNLGVADVLLKPIEEQVARTLFLNIHRYSRYRTAVTIPRYANQNNTLALPSHARLRNVFLKDQWLSDILIQHYCPTPTRASLQSFPSMSTYAAKERVEHLKAKLLSWDFHPHDLCQDDLMRCVAIVLEEVMKLDGLGDLNIPEHLLHRFVVGLRDSYHRSNPYHNFAHAVDVLQATFYFLCRMGKLPHSGYGYPPIPQANGETDESTAQGLELTESLANIPAGSSSTAEQNAPSPIRVQDFLRPEDIFALVVASIGHDVGHPGVNNMFLVNAHTPLAQVYNDRSVLESFHSMALFQVMKKHGFECFDVDSQNRKFMEFRKMVVSTILATDMGLHFDYVGKIKEQTERLRLRNLPGGNVPKPNQASIDEQERLVLCGTIIKCADISNASRPFHVAERWSAVLLQEMCNQADIEKEMTVCSGAPSVPPGSTKSLANDRGMQIDSQLGFIHGFAMPLFSSVKEMIPEMGYCVDLLQINHKIWEGRKTEYLKNGGGSFTVALTSIKSYAEEEPRPQPQPQSQLQKVVVPTLRRPGNHRRAKSQAGRGSPSTKDGAKPLLKKSPSTTDVDENRRVPEITVPLKLHTGHARRTPNSSHVGVAELPSSTIPRPRTRTKAVTSEGSVLPATFGQESRQKGQSRGNASQQPGRSRPSGSREPNGRVRSVTTTSSLSLPLPTSSTGSKAGSHTSSPKMQQYSLQPNTQTPTKPSSRSQRSPGRRPQNQSSHGPVSLPKQEKASVLSFGESPGEPQVGHPEPIVLGALLPVSVPSNSTAGTDPDRSESSEPSFSNPPSPSQPKSSPTTPPQLKEPRVLESPPSSSPGQAATIVV